ncbi:MAG: glycosyltransferase family 2 protein [Elusimicrobiota bacterium]
MGKVSIVVPVYHNEKNLEDTFRELEKLGEKEDLEFVYVDDDSKDGSLKMLEAYAKREPRATVVKLSRNFGSMVACVAGLAHATGDAAVIIACDLQDPPELILQMVARWKEGYQVVLAAREGRDEPFLQRLFAGIFYRLMRRFALADMPVGGFDFFLIDRKLIDIVVAMREKNTSLMGLVLWLGFKRTTIRYTRRRRTKGKSMWTFQKKIKFFIDSFVAFSYAPVRAAQWLGLTSAVLGFLYALLLIVLRLVHNTALPGWTALIVIILMLGGIQMLILGVIGEYLWRTLDETKHRPLFVVEKIVKA